MCARSVALRRTPLKGARAVGSKACAWASGAYGARAGAPARAPSRREGETRRKHDEENKLGKSRTYEQRDETDEGVTKNPTIQENQGLTSNVTNLTKT
jgi:hypothetical protein